MPNSNRIQLSPPRLSPKMYRVADSKNDNAWQYYICLVLKEKKKNLFFVAFHFASFIHSPQKDTAFVSRSSQHVFFQLKSLFFPLL